MLSYIGNVQFQDMFTPARGKNEWGVDTLTRKLEGARTLLDAFLATLAQGQRYLQTAYYLQSWEPDEGTPFSIVQLNYKGLLKGTPQPIVINSTVPSSGSTSANFSNQNGGKGVVYRKEVIYGTGGQSNVILAEQDVYATGASMDFSYDAGQTVYRYISVGQPNGPKYSALGFNFTPTIRRARVTVNDGNVYGLNVPIAIGPSLLPGSETRAVGFNSMPIIGTPYFECEDIVRTEMG